MSDLIVLRTLESRLGGIYINHSINEQHSLNYVYIVGSTDSKFYKCKGLETLVRVTEDIKTIEFFKGL